jgi:hypothetical protein
MKIINETGYETRPLATIIRRVAAEELEPSKRKRAVITIKYQRRGTRKLGHATIGGTRCSLLVPRPEVPPPAVPQFDREQFAKICAHEFAHLRGMRHRQMRGNPRYDWVEGDRGWRKHVQKMEYCAGVLITLKRPKSRPKDTDATKLSRVLLRISDWETKRKRAENALRKYKKRQRYYERKLQCAADKLKV